nr:DJ-1 family glyoxalase III [Actinomyces sp.]
MAELTAATDKKVAVLVAPGLEEVEALAPLDILFRAGIPADLISITRSRQVTSSHQVVLSCSATLAELSEADLESYDMIFLPGGIPGTPNLKADARVRHLVTQRVRTDRPVAAICAAPSILAELGLLEGRRATANPGFVQVLADHGAQVSEASVVVDGRLLTSRGMATAVDLGLEMVRFYLGDAAVEEMKERIVYQG